jgi:hypothetical protein
MIQSALIANFLIPEDAEEAVVQLTETEEVKTTIGT